MKNLLVVFFGLSLLVISFAGVCQAADIADDSGDSNIIVVTTDPIDKTVDDNETLTDDTNDVTDSVDDTDSIDDTDSDDSVDEADPPIPFPVFVDIKPGSCPNPLNVKSKGMLPVAILGTEDLDVLDVDPSSIRLEGVAPQRSGIEDVSTPLNNEEDCYDHGVDGYDDLILKFDTQEVVEAVVAALGTDVVDGDELLLTLTGVLGDGTAIEGQGTVIIIKKGKK